MQLLDTPGSGGIDLGSGGILIGNDGILAGSDGILAGSCCYVVIFNETLQFSKI